MTVIVASPGVEASRVVVQRTLVEAPVESALVLDYRGVAERILDADTTGKMTANGCTWIDLADLVRPTRLLEFGRCPGPTPDLARLLQRFADVLRLPMVEDDARRARAFLDRLVGNSAQGRTSLSEFRAALINEEVCRWTWPRESPIEDTRPARQRIRSVVDAALRYSHLAALSTAPTSFPSPWERAPGTIWAELPRNHVEAGEWALLSQALHGWGESLDVEEASASGRIPILLHPPDPGDHEALAPVVGTRRDAIVAIATHPMGRPPNLLKHLLVRGGTVRLEWKGACPDGARTAWIACLGNGSGLWERLRHGGPAAFLFQSGSVREAPPVFLANAANTAQQAVAVVVPVLREAGRSSRLPTPYANAAEATGVRQGDDGRSRDPYDRLCSAGTLTLAWTSVVTVDSGGDGGMDGVSVRSFGTRLPAELEALRTELLEDRYQPTPPRWFTIPKADGKERRIGIASVRDRVVQRAFLYVSEPFFEPHFNDRSYAFRPGRSAHHAILAVLGAWRRGARFLAHVDVESCFDTVPHELLMARYAQRVSSPRMLALLSRMLRFGVALRAFPDVLGIGVVQGWVLSPFLSNVVLDELDEHLEARGIDFHRYADDLALAGEREADVQAAVGVVDEVLRTRLQMRLKASKTRIASLESGADFLGFRIGGPGMLAMAPDRFLAAREALREGVQAVTEATRGRSRDRAIRRVGEQITGLAAYFARLGVGSSLEQQFKDLNAVISENRAALPEEIRSHEAWSRIPDPREWQDRYGTLLESTGETQNKSSVEPYGNVGPAQGVPWVLVPETQSALPEPSKVSPAETAATHTRTDDRLAPAPFAEMDGTTLLVMRGGLWLGADDECIRLKQGKDEVFSVPAPDVQTVLVQSYGVRFSSHAMWALAARGIGLIVANPAGDDIALMQGAQDGRPEVRLRQARRQGDADVQAAGIDMLRAKIANQASLLRYLARAPARRDTEQGASLQHAADEMRVIEGQLTHAARAPGPDPAQDAARWMGYEGLAAARYWSALQLVLPADLGFPGRRTRGATDPVNVSLNYAYGMLYADVWRAVARSGLDPGLGILHRTTRSPGALVYDLIEELRAPLADRLVFALIGRGWRPALKEHSIAVLTPRNRFLLARSWRSQREQAIRRGRSDVRVKDLPFMQAKALRDLFTGQADRYPAFRFRW